MGGRVRESQKQQALWGVWEVQEGRGGGSVCKVAQGFGDGGDRGLRVLLFLLAAAQGVRTPGALGLT